MTPQEKLREEIVTALAEYDRVGSILAIVERERREVGKRVMDELEKVEGCGEHFCNCHPQYMDAARAAADRVNE